MSRRKQVGFIKTYSSKQLLLHDEPSEFSYFRLKGTRDDDEEFSPYKFEGEEVQAATLPMPLPYKKKQKQPAKPPLPQRKERIVPHPAHNLIDKAKADQLYDRIKHKIAQFEGKRSAGKEFEENIGSIRNKIERIDEVLKDLKTNNDSSSAEKRAVKQHRFQSQEKQQPSSSSQSQSEAVIIGSIPSPQVHASNQIPRMVQKSRHTEPPRTHSAQIRRNSVEGRRSSNDVHMYSKQRQSSNSHRKAQEKITPIKNNEELSESEEQDSQPQHLHSQHQNNQHPHQDKVITFNSRIKNQPPLFIKPYSSSSSDSEQQEEEQPSHPPPRTHTQKTQPQENQAQTQFYKNKGGVCFEVDVKQFTAPLPPQQQSKPVRQPKTAPVDKKAELLRRRETAKAYDKQARRAVFSPY